MKLLRYLLLSGIILWTFCSSDFSLTRTMAGKQHIIVGSKNFMENRLLAEIFAQLIEAKTSLNVQRRLGLAGTQVCFEALRTGAIDLYPEYTGTGLVSILEHPPTGDPRAALNTVRSEFLKRWDLWWLNPLGFENSYALAVPRPQIKSLSLQTISDLASIASSLSAGLGYEFIAVSYTHLTLPTNREV